MKTRVTFTVKVPVDLNDDDCKEMKEVVLDAKKPNLAEINEAQLAYNRGFDIAICSKAPLRIEVERLLKKRGIWTEDKEEELKKLNTELAVLVNKLLAGGMRLLDARKTALEIKDKRNEIASLTIDRNILDQSTAEAQAEGARFHWFVANCVVYNNTGKLFFVDPEKKKENVTVYLEQAHHDFAVECAKQFGRLQYGLDPDFEKKFPENNFLLKFRFVRQSDLRLINRQNQLIDREDHLIDEQGFKIDTQGNRLDRTGVPLDKETGQPKVKGLPFLDDDGQPIEDSELAVVT